MIEEKIYSLLNTSAITAVFGTQIFPMFADETKDTPYIVYSVMDDVETKTHSGRNGHHEAQIAVTLWCDDYLTACQNKAVVIDVLDAYRDDDPEEGDETYDVFVQSIFVAGTSDVYDYQPGVDSSIKYGKRITLDLSYEDV